MACRADCWRPRGEGRKKPIGAEQAAEVPAFSALKLVEEGAFAERERNRYVSRSLGYLVLLNGAAALVLMAVVALNPESSSHWLAWAMIVFGSGPSRFLPMSASSSRYRLSLRPEQHSHVAAAYYQAAFDISFPAHTIAAFARSRLVSSACPRWRKERVGTREWLEARP